MTRLQQAHARRAKVRAIQAKQEAFVETHIAETGDQPSLVISTILEYAFEALVVQMDSLDQAGGTAHEIFEALCVKHKLNAQTERSLVALGARVTSRPSAGRSAA